MYTAREIFKKLCEWSPLERETTGDGLVFGDFDRRVRTVAVTVIASPDVIRKAAEMGADMILTHEPTFHSAVAGEEDAITAQKRALCEETGIPIVRLHDYMHFTKIDKINLGVMSRISLDGDFDGQKTFTLKTPMTADALIDHVGKKLGLRHIRYIGKGDITVNKLSLLFGAWGDARIYSEFLRPEIDIVLIGEGCEYNVCEYVRDAVELGVKKGLVILGHMGSEKAGMEYLADYINENLEAVNAIYIDSGEVYKN